MDQRWSDDTRGHGVASAEPFIPALDRLRSAMAEATWVAEEPEAHLLPHISRVAEREGFGWSLISATVEDAVLVITLVQPDTGPRDLHEAAYALIGSFAESNTFMREGRNGDDTVFEVVTGMLDGDGAFVGHGHMVRFVFRSGQQS
jgi:hypothetical protein